jgi:hypothetical protein
MSGHYSGHIWAYHHMLLLNGLLLYDFLAPHIRTFFTCSHDGRWVFPTVDLFPQINALFSVLWQHYLRDIWLGLSGSEY